MSSQSQPHQMAAGGKVTVLNSGELQPGPSTSAETAASAASSDSDRHARRKVGTTLERSFQEPPKSQPDGGDVPSGSRPVLKAGKAVSSAPPVNQRPMTELELEFASKPTEHQRWLLSFPMALKHLYFSYAESPNHEQILANLINKFPDLLRGSENAPSAIQVAIERGNWGPAAKFVAACTAEQYKLLLRQQCGIERRTFLTLAIERASSAPAGEDEQARRLIVSLARACPDLMTLQDAGGRNPMHFCARLCPERLLHPLLTDLRSVCLDCPELARCLGDALVARDAEGRQPAEAASAPAVQDLLRGLQADFPPPSDSEDQPMPESTTGTAANRERLCSELARRGKSDAFLECLTAIFVKRKDYRVRLLPTVENPIQQALDWYGEANTAEIRQVLADIGEADLCALV